MRRRIVAGGAWAVLLGTLTGCPLVPNDRDRLRPTLPSVEVRDLPPAVVATCQRLFPDQEIAKAYRSGQSDGRTHFVVWVGRSGQAERAATLTEEGVPLDR